jgi:hypothetical protein
MKQKVKKVKWIAKAASAVRGEVRILTHVCLRILELSNVAI